MCSATLMPFTSRSPLAQAFRLLRFICLRLQDRFTRPFDHDGGAAGAAGRAWRAARVLATAGEQRQTVPRSPVPYRQIPAQLPQLAFYQPGAALPMGCAFVDRYVNEKRQNVIRFVTPHQRHSGQATATSAQRTLIYDSARNTIHAADHALCLAGINPPLYGSFSLPMLRQ